MSSNLNNSSSNGMRASQMLPLILLMVVGLYGVGAHSQPGNSAIGGRPEMALDGGSELTLLARQRAAEAELMNLLTGAGSGSSAGANKLPHLLANARFRRQVAAAAAYQQQHQKKAPQAQQPPPFPLAPISQQQQQQQLLLDDEQTIRSQLPDLIAQAHNDKTVERALIKMLISASLRSALSNMQQQSGPYGLSTMNNNNSPQQQWQEDNINDQQQQQQYPLRFTRLDQQQRNNFDSLDSLSGAIDSLASGANGAIGSSQLVQSSAPGDQYQQVDKREYIKPCSFNAVSCVRTPFRRT